MTSPRSRWWCICQCLVALSFFESSLFCCWNIGEIPISAIEIPEVSHMTYLYVLIICVDFAHDISFFVGLDSLFLVTANLVTNDTHTQERLRSVNCNDGNFCQTKQKGLILSCTPCSTTCEAEGLPLGASTHNRLSQLAEWIPSIERAGLAKGICWKELHAGSPQHASPLCLREASVQLANSRHSGIAPSKGLDPCGCLQYRTLVRQVASLGSRACNSFRSCFAWQCWCKTVHPSYAQQPLPLGHRQYHCREIDCARRCCFIAAQGIYSRATHSSAHVFLFDLPVSAALRSGSSNLATADTPI